MHTTDPILEMNIESMKSMELNRFELLTLLDKTEANKDDKEAVEDVLKQIYGDKWFTVSSECLSQFTMDLKNLKRFGDKITKLHLRILPLYIKALLHVIPNPMFDVTELAFYETTENRKVAKQKSDLKAIREFLNQLGDQFPQLRRLSLGYLFWCEDCPYFDCLVQPFASLTAIKLSGDFSYSDFLNFIALNRQIEEVALVNNNPTFCNGVVCSWKLPDDFIHQLDSSLPNLKHLELFIPCTMDNLKITKDHFKNLETLKYGLHGLDTWMPDLLVFSGHKLRNLCVQMDVGKLDEEFFKKSSHLIGLRKVAISALFDEQKVGKPYDISSEPTSDQMRSFILSHDHLSEIMIRLVAFPKNDHFLRGLESFNEDKETECEKCTQGLQRKYRKIIHKKLNGYQWRVYSPLLNHEVNVAKFLKT